MLKRILLLFAVLIPVGAFGQGVAIQGVTASQGPGNLVRVVPFATVVVCGYPATGGTPCTNTASTFNGPTLSTPCTVPTQVVGPATTTCISTSDFAGNFTMFVATGSAYTYYFRSNNTWFGPYVVTGAGATAPVGTANQVIVTGTTISLANPLTFPGSVSGPSGTFTTLNTTTLGATTGTVTTLGSTTATITTETVGQLALTGDVTGTDVCSGSLYSMSCNDATKVSALCNSGATGTLTLLTCLNATDVYTAIRNYVLAVGAKGTFHIVDDMCSFQTWSGNPFSSPGNAIMVGTFDFRTNCSASLPQIVLIDGTSTIGVPGGLTVNGGGTAIGALTPQYGGSGNTVQGTFIRACNPAIMPCANGGFVQQSGAIDNITVSGNLALVTMVAKPFTQSTTAINNIQQYRMIHIVGATGAAIPDNAAWVISDCNTTYPGGCATNPQTFHIAVPTGFQACTHGSGCGTAYLDTPVMSIGTGGGNGVFGARIRNLTIDCAFLPGTIGWVNGIGQELTGLNDVNAYNCTVAGGRIDQSAAYNGASFASSNSGDYGPFSSNTQNATCGNTTCECFGGSGANNGTISSFSGTSGTLTFQSAASNILSGTSIILSAFGGGNTGLNGQIVTVLSAGLTANQFEAVVTGSGYASGTGAWLGGGPNVCSSLVQGTPGTVPLGAAMSCGSGTSLATIFPDPCVNANFRNFLFTGSLGQQGFGLTNHITATLSDKSGSGGLPVPQFAMGNSGTTNNYGPGGIVPGTGATYGAGIGFYGIHGTIIDYHHEYALTGIDIGGDPNRSGTYYYAYTNPTAPATAVITSSVQIINGFAGAANFGGGTSIEVDIGGSVADAPFIGDINIQGLNMQNGGAAIDVQNNVNGETCKTFGTAPGSDYVMSYQFGHSTTASSANLGLTGLALPMRITSCASLPAFVGNAFSIPMISTNQITFYGAVVKADTANAGQFVVTNHTTDTGAGIAIGVNYYPSAALGFGAVVTSGIVPMRFDTAGTGNCSSLGMFVIVGTSNDGRVQCTAGYVAGTVIGKNVSTTSSTNAVVNVLVGLK